MRLDVFTLFPEWFEWFQTQRHVRNVVAAGSELRFIDYRETTPLGAGQVDDSPYGGGAGMVMRVDVVDAALEAAYGAERGARRTVLLTPSGRMFDEELAIDLASEPELTLLCGRYEGVDERVHTHLVDGELSIGDYVLAGGEVAAMVVIEAVGRLVPGVLGNEVSVQDESFATGLLEYPQYTRPADFRGWEVPEVLRSGDHARITRWRRAQALARTAGRRPDLIEARGGISDDERALLEEFGLGG